MNTLALLSVFLLLAISQVLANVPGKTYPAPVIVVNLDLPPANRWDAAINYYGPAAKTAINNYFNSFTKSVPASILSMIKWAAARFEKFGNMNKDVKEEMEAIAKKMNMDLGTIVALNYLYELRALGPKANTTGPLPPNARDGSAGWCTSIVAQSKASGAVLHVRNMDWNLPNDVRNLTFNCAWQKGGKTVFSGACFLGFVGMASGYATPQGAGTSRFGVTINERDAGGNLVVDALMAIFTGSYDPTHLLRHVFLTAQSYDEAVHLLRTEKLSAPAYYIVSGEGTTDGHVITRNRASVHSDRQIDAKNWFVGQTNYDWDTQPPSYDDRRKYMLASMSKLSPASANEKSLLNVIRTAPVENEHTSYQTFMDPKNDKFEVFVHLKA